MARMRDHLSGAAITPRAVVKCGQRKGARLAVCRRSEWRPADPQSVNLLYPSQAGISLPAVILPGLLLLSPFLVLPFTAGCMRSSRYREHLRYRHRSVWSRPHRYQNDDHFCSKGKARSRRLPMGWQLTA